MSLPIRPFPAGWIGSCTSFVELLFVRALGTSSAGKRDAIR